MAVFIWLAVPFEFYVLNQLHAEVGKDLISAAFAVLLSIVLVYAMSAVWARIFVSRVSLRLKEPEHIRSQMKRARVVSAIWSWAAGVILLALSYALSPKVNADWIHNSLVNQLDPTLCSALGCLSYPGFGAFFLTHSIYFVYSIAGSLLLALGVQIRVALAGASGGKSNAEKPDADCIDPWIWSGPIIAAVVLFFVHVVLFKTLW